jgi:hypothetical protein
MLSFLFRWFNLGGPDELNNGIARCSLHHKLFDRGALDLDEEYRILVSGVFSARTDAAQRIYDCTAVNYDPAVGTIFLPSRTSPGTAEKSSGASRSLFESRTTPDPSTLGSADGVTYECPHSAG